MLAGLKLRLNRPMNRVNHTTNNEEAVIFLEQEMKKFIQMTRPVFLLKDESEEMLVNFLQTSKQRTGLKQRPQTKESRQRAAFFDKDLPLFVKYCKAQGFQMEGNEMLFSQVLMNSVDLWNFQFNQKKYGRIVQKGDSIRDVFERYLDQVDESEQYQITSIEFLRQSMISQRLLPVSIKAEKLIRQLLIHEKRNSGEELRRFEKRLNNV
ncbi:hypothetical protein [Geomicrobium sp. JCM 19039]|uniref:hypothetical protein n=1 Tax=Geomicrobium sp. JCM 19039 TaxID=1460636 RepID=UPI00045F295B|nr:hypothetical protein [Geomicrobium sp. JCM 19039]GAK11145.1 hypothetical protein JCM19039_821 [Geomicrobium sp. JCM 19039]